MVVHNHRGGVRLNDVGDKVVNGVRIIGVGDGEIADGVRALLAVLTLTASG